MVADIDDLETLFLAELLAELDLHFPGSSLRLLLLESASSSTSSCRVAARSGSVSWEHGL